MMDILLHSKSSPLYKSLTQLSSPSFGSLFYSTSSPLHKSLSQVDSPSYAASAVFHSNYHVVVNVKPCTKVISQHPISLIVFFW